MRNKGNLVPLSLIFILAGMTAAAEEPLPFVNQHFKLEFKSRGIVSLGCVYDAYDTNYIMDDKILGEVFVRYRMLDGPWEEFDTSVTIGNKFRVTSELTKTGPEYFIAYNSPADWDDYSAAFELSVRFRFDGDALVWTFHLRNLTDKPLEVGDLALSLPLNTYMGWNKDETYTKRVFTHDFISGHGSFIYWMRPNSEGPFLVMTPLTECPTYEADSWHRERNFRPAKLEYAERRRGGDYAVFIHSSASRSAARSRDGAVARERGGAGRRDHSSVTLMPKFTPDDGITYGFKFRWAGGLDEVRDVLYEESLFDVHVVPGMAVPEDLHALFSLRTKNRIASIAEEYPDQTQIAYLGEKTKDTHIYKVKFARLGENTLTVNCDDGRDMQLEFFVTEPLETLIKKRAAFLVQNQVRDPSQWYDGLFPDWDMVRKEKSVPEDFARVSDYWMTSDDPSLSKPAFISEKNVHYPIRGEIEALEYYIQRYVWGKLQRTDQETYPYGVYGIPNWKLNRESEAKDRRGWAKHLWRAYDYPHVIMLYYNMYRIASRYPTMVHYLNDRQYLKRAFHTAKAFFTVPSEIANWSAHSLGYFNELVIVDIIEELYANGLDDEAEWLKREWEKKVAYFVNDDPNLFHSEFPFDDTNFESTHALAAYALRQSANSSSTLDVRVEDAMAFMERQIAANLVRRGWLEPAYYLLGGSKRLSYMSQLGGWSITDYALNHSPERDEYLRLGYASYLSGWVLMNTGTHETDYGYWYPGKDNDGAARYGSRSTSFEVDLGYCGALRTSATIMTEDPLFGLFVYGGRFQRGSDFVEIILKDGLRKRLYLFRGDQRLSLILDRDGFAAARPIMIDDAFRRISFALESRTGDDHVSKLRISGLPAGTYQLTADGVIVGTFVAASPAELVIELPVKCRDDNEMEILMISGGSRVARSDHEVDRSEFAGRFR